MEDSEILELYRSGEEQQAFNLIMRKYNERLYWHIRKLVCDHDDTNDLLQNTFIKVWRSLGSFREDSRLYTWLYRIATNEALTFLKKKSLKANLSLSDYSKVLENKIETDSSFNGDYLQLALQKSIAKLPPKQKLVFNMRYFDEMKYEDISEILNISVGALKASYHHAYNKVQESLKQLVEV
ncbi:MAG: RNA polymerase sigma factor [Bacteroidales bacterium]|nr:RNA polymerase sigma factor [Bacteroidales bacterium]MDD4670588.1 RNA polymerase sigma factor [Bacteroidales bacterium]